MMLMGAVAEVLRVVEGRKMLGRTTVMVVVRVVTGKEALLDSNVIGPTRCSNTIMMTMTT